jgi:hypothetical protein
MNAVETFMQHLKRQIKGTQLVGKYLVLCPTGHIV